MVWLQYEWNIAFLASPPLSRNRPLQGGSNMLMGAPLYSTLVSGSHIICRNTADNVHEK
jgi:hypothetical protein